MEITHKLKVDLLQQGEPHWLDAVQNDDLSRTVELLLFCGGQIWLPPEGTTAAVAYRRPDGSGGLYDTVSDGAHAVNICGNRVKIALTQQMLMLPGTVSVSVVLYQKAKQLSTFPFRIRVSEDPSATHRGCGQASPMDTLASLHNAVDMLKRNIGNMDINIRKWAGKKILVDGSSITAGGSGTLSPSWAGYLPQLLPGVSVYNHAVGGSAWFSDTGVCPLIRRLSGYEADADAVILMGDYNGVETYVVNPGTIADAADPNGSCYGKLKFLAEQLLEKFPLAPILWVAEPPRSHPGNLTGCVPMDLDADYSQYAKAMAAVAAYYGFSFCNLMKNTLFRPWNAENYAATTPDGVHPAHTVQHTMAQVIAELLKQTPVLYAEGGTPKVPVQLQAQANPDATLYESDPLERVRACLDKVVLWYSDGSCAVVQDFAVSGNITAGLQRFTLTHSDIQTEVSLLVAEGEREMTTISVNSYGVSQGKWLFAWGDGSGMSEESKDGYGCTDFINVLPGTGLQLSDDAGTNALSTTIVEYDAHKQFIRGSKWYPSTSALSLSAQTAYVRVNLQCGTAAIATFAAGSAFVPQGRVAAYPFENGSLAMEQVSLTIRDGNRVTVTIPSWTYACQLNISNLHHNSSNPSTAANVQNQPLQFKLKAGDVLRTVLKHREGHSITNPISVFLVTAGGSSTTNLFPDTAVDIETTITMSSDFDVGAIGLYMPACSGGPWICDFELELYVNDVPYI